jgi:hypothetical protein
MNSRHFPEEAVLKTELGTFYFTLTRHRDRNTQKITRYMISIGGKANKCVQIVIPSEESDEKEGSLLWVESKESCTLLSNVSGKLPQHMVQLGFSIANDINPKCTKYTLDDCSKIPCELPNGKTQWVSLKPYHIAFHGRTWYEHYFGAKLLTNHEIYDRLKKNMYDSAKKPPTFDFINAELQDELAPIYAKERTWSDFFQTISNKYGRKKCAVVYPWIMNALLHIFENSNIFEHPKWYIDVEENRRTEKTPLIPFTSYEVKWSGGLRRRNRKTRKHSVQSVPIYFVNIPEAHAMKYKDFIQS